jgi:ADP-ribosylarginine hydrolase
MIKITEKIEASLMIASYLETIGFKNAHWEFNLNLPINNKSSFMRVWTLLLHNYMILGGSNIDITGWNASDDTILILATALGSVEGGGEELYKKYYLEYLEKLSEDKRVPGVNTIKTLKLVKQGKIITTLPINSSMGGNGAAMRTGPIGLLWYKNIERVIEESLIASKLTHNYYIGFLGGMVTAVFTAFAMNNIEPWKWCDELIKLYNDGIIHKYYLADGKHKIEDLNIYMGYWKKYKETRISKLIYKNTSTNFIYADERTYFLLGFTTDSIIRKQLEQGTNFSDLENIKWDGIGGSGLDSCIYAYDCLLSSMNTPGSVKLDFNNITYSWDSFVALVAIHPGDNDTTAAIGGTWYGALLGYHMIDKNRMEELEFYKELKKVSDKIIKNI